jgi:hypothetical protein
VDIVPAARAGRSRAHCMSRILSLLVKHRPGLRRARGHEGRRRVDGPFAGSQVGSLLLYRCETVGHGSPGWARWATAVWLANGKACPGGKIMQASCMASERWERDGADQRLTGAAGSEGPGQRDQPDQLADGANNDDTPRSPQTKRVGRPTIC